VTTPRRCAGYPLAAFSGESARIGATVRKVFCLMGCWPTAAIACGRPTVRNRAAETAAALPRRLAHRLPSRANLGITHIICLPGDQSKLETNLIWDGRRPHATGRILVVRLRMARLYYATAIHLIDSILSIRAATKYPIMPCAVWNDSVASSAFLHHRFRLTRTSWATDLESGEALRLADDWPDACTENAAILRMTSICN
jgi:hypothetical protein